MKVGEVPKPIIKKPTDAIIKVLRACVCGSDLWWYRGISKREGGTTVGHEAIGVVEEVGDAVTAVQPGDFVVAPFTHGCGRCAACLAVFDGNCLVPNEGANGGYQGEYLCFEKANWALVKIPGQPSDYTDQQLNNLLTLSDVIATGFHAAKSAEVKKGATTVVIGDDAVKHVMDLTTGHGADSVLECVSATGAVEQAAQVARAGAVVGRVGVPQKEPDTGSMFWKNIGLRGWIASVTTYDKSILLKAVLDGEIDPGKVFTKRFDLDHIQEAYKAMDHREAIKSSVIVADK